MIVGRRELLAATIVVLVLLAVIPVRGVRINRNKKKGETDPPLYGSQDGNGMMYSSLMVDKRDIS
jgi:hypothetical protein